MWTKHVLEVRGFPVKVYVSEDGHQAVMFFLFGKYSRLYSDENVLDFATDFLCGNSNNVMSFSSYQTSLEDTAVIELDEVA